MVNLLILFFFYTLILISSLGFGFLLTSKKDKEISIGFIGLKGIFILILLSYLTNFFLKHNYFHNSLILFMGLFLFVFNFKIKNFLKNYKLILILVLISFIGILVHKNHDDFFYYHFGYTFSLVNFTKIIGLGNLEHGFRTPSSIFYLNSLYYLPGINYFIMHSGAILFFLFSNIFFVEKIFKLKTSRKNFFILFLCLFSFIFVNTIFSRISEHGTDRSALILVFVLSVILLESLNNKIKTFRLFESYYNKILIILFLIISLKVFYLIYLVFLLLFFYEYKLVLNNFLNLKKILINKYTILFCVGLFLIILTMFLNTGCFIYPASFTCVDKVSWAIEMDQVKKMYEWYELWSKAGASPNYRVENPLNYIQNFNWVSNWMNNYFFNKVSDFIFALVFISIVVILFFNSSKKNITKINFKFFYILSILLLIEWFYNHPALRYGGYSLIALLIFIPVSIYLSKISKLKNFLYKFKIIIFISLFFFLSKNIIRIYDENSKYGYHPFKNPYYDFNEKLFDYDKTLTELKKVSTKNNKKLLIINKELLKEVEASK